MSKPTIGFIGLVLMGGNMVENLQKLGFEVVSTPPWVAHQPMQKTDC